jgi:hypothetical protein
MATIASRIASTEHTRTASVADTSFPGPIVTAICLIAGPLLAIAGLVLSFGVYKFKGADMMSAMAAHHVRGWFALNLSVVSMIVILVAVIALAHKITAVKPAWGRWSGIVAIVGLMGPIFFLGIDWGSYQLTDASYQAAGAHLIDHANIIPSTLMNISVPCVVLGWILLGIASYKAGILPRWRAVCLGLTCLLAPGLAAAIVPLGIAAMVFLAIAFVPLGLEMLSSGEAAAVAPSQA